MTLLAHNWGFLTGAAVIREKPDLFDRLVILNVNSLPDGELVPSRFPNLALESIILLFKGQTFPRLRDLRPTPGGESRNLGQALYYCTCNIFHLCNKPESYSKSEI